LHMGEVDSLARDGGTMKAFIMGAGASSGTVGAPVTDEFGRALACRSPNWRECYAGLGKVIDYLHVPPEGWGLDAVWTCIDFHDKLRGLFEKPVPWEGEPARLNLSKALLEVYGKSCDEAVDRLPLDGSYTLGGLLGEELQPGDVLISFNYDTVAERLAARFGKQLRTARRAEGNGRVTVAKPHGSTSWARYTDGRVETHTVDGGVLLDSLSPEDVDRGREPLVVGAVPFKSELIHDLQQHAHTPAVHETMVDQWKTVIGALQRADTMVVVGYSFPKEDCYGHFLVREALRRREGPLAVEFYSSKENAEKWAREQEEEFAGMILSPRYRGEVRGLK
jgi:hypothetical protein